MSGEVFTGTCTRCAQVAELYWIRKSLVCRECINVNIVSRQDLDEPPVRMPGFYRSADTFTIGITCPDCAEPDNLIHSACVIGLDLLDSVKLSHVQYVEWIAHRRVVHGEQV